MKYKGRTKILIPYMDGNVRNWLCMELIGDVDHRRVRREVRKFAYEAFRKRVPKAWIMHVPIIVPQGGGDWADRLSLEEFTEKFIQRIQYDETENESDTSSKGSATA